MCTISSFLCCVIFCAFLHTFFCAAFSPANFLRFSQGWAAEEVAAAAPPVGQRPHHGRPPPRPGPCFGGPLAPPGQSNVSVLVLDIQHFEIFLFHNLFGKLGGVQLPNVNTVVLTDISISVIQHFPHVKSGFFFEGGLWMPPSRKGCC